MKYLSIFLALLFASPAFAVDPRRVTASADGTQIFPASLVAPGGALVGSSAFTTALSGKVSLTGSYSNPTWITGFAWSKVSSTPTTLSGYGITDPIVLTSGSYANPSWITGLAWSKVSSTPTTIAGYGISDGVSTGGTYSNPSWITMLGWSKITSTPTTLSGYGITDPIVLTSGSYANPSWITGLAWSKVSTTPTTLSGYGITDPIVLTSGSYSNPSWITALSASKLTSGTVPYAQLPVGTTANTVAAGDVTTAALATKLGLHANADTASTAAGLNDGSSHTVYWDGTFSYWHTASDVRSDGNIIASSFIGAGTGLSGTATSLSIGGNAATASAVPFSGVSGTPTNRAGYGLLDAAASGSNSDITSLSALQTIIVTKAVSTGQAQIKYDGTHGFLIAAQSDGSVKFFAVASTDTATSYNFTTHGSSGTSVFDIDALHGRVGVNNAAPAYPLDVTGDINTTGVFRINGTALAASATTDTTIASNISATEASQAMVSGGGTAAANAIYTLNADGNYYAPNGYFLQFNITNWIIYSPGGVPTSLYNGSNTTFPWQSVWTTTGGAGPVPTVTQVPTTVQTMITRRLPNAGGRLTVSGATIFSDGNALPTLAGINTWTNNQTLNGTANTAPNQTAASGSSIMTRSLGDARFCQQSVTAVPTPTYTKVSGAARVYLTRYWNVPAQTNGFSSNDGYGGIFAEGFVFMSGTSALGYSIQLTGPVNFSAGQMQGWITDSVAGGRFSVNIGAGSVDLLDGTISSRLKMMSSGVASQKLRYKFGTNFSANAGDTIVMSPSGHTFIVDDTITDATVWTSASVGGVSVRSIEGGGAPTTSDTSLTVNGGSAITTTYVANTASNTGVHPVAILFPSSIGINLYTKTFGIGGGFNITATK